MHDVIPASILILSSIVSLFLSVRYAIHALSHHLLDFLSHLTMSTSVPLLPFSVYFFCDIYNRFQQLNG